MHAMAKLGLGDRITREEMEDIISSPRYAKTEKEVTTMIFVRSVLGRVIESFMLLDRYLYLHEVSERMEREGQGEHVRIRMLNLFDFRESPRNAVVIAEKVGKDSI
ncbi:hypothetical protein BC829DRAFT_387640 [Chytridium lagenaria]|nr:hypothetical protein BC829DRAFT_387640 [Chytridium lagenaria]